MIIKRLIKKGKKVVSNVQVDYLNFLELPIDEKLVLVEGGQGTNINGNMFSMLRELCSNCLLYTSPSPRDATLSRMPSSA